MLNDYEIVTSVQAESGPVDDERGVNEENNNESSKGPSNAGAFSALETDVRTTITVLSYSTTVAQKRIRDLAAKKRRCTMVQRKISDHFPQ
ncbi:uncharacterized protein TNCV_1786331 [Trichonephila clavipes]|nr:uncharacterized protein TNCV_1786331 [Trichonephila clavipes]